MKNFAGLVFIGLALAIWPDGRSQAEMVFSSLPSTFQTPVDKDNLDPATFSEWVDGAEKPVTPNYGPFSAIWTTTTQPPQTEMGVKFGDTKNQGLRYLRIGLKTPVSVGSVLTRGGGRLSVLKPNATYPGRLDHDEDWLPAEWLKNGQMSLAQAWQNDYAW